MSENNYHVPNLERALEILELLSKFPEGLQQKDLIEKLKFSKNSIYRITMTLMSWGYIIRDDETRRFVLTRKMMLVGASAMGDQNLAVKAIDSMRDLRDKINMTVLLGVLDGNEGVIIEQAVGGHPFKFSVDLGARFLLHSGAPGKALLAYLPEEERNAILDTIILTKFNERTICTKSALKKEFSKVRECGYAIDKAEQFEGCHCAGAVIKDHTGLPIAALWVTSPSISFPESRFEEIGKLTVECCSTISKKFGFQN
jgi:DNA-binding IclR family transcriptional regulator